MLRRLRNLVLRYFDGDRRIGPRRDYIIYCLKNQGSDPVLDRYGNVWVEKGSGDNIILLSAHIDVDPRISKLDFRTYPEGNKKIVAGVLDNALGCYLNLSLSRYMPKNGKIICVFTASEEISKKNPRKFARSAREIVEQLKEQNIKPKLCIAIDVTYPRLLYPQDRINWNAKYSYLFDLTDTTHCYLDGYIKKKEYKIVADLLSSVNVSNVSSRNFRGHDEAFIYSKLAPSFACGPVVYGHFDQPDQKMPVSHIKTSLRFLKGILKYYLS